ncbi:MAG: hypothetical protein M0R49_06900 [Limnochordia bacterium]|jgi:hypothetical protein|nr:hypothetical protein [Limnochordia bacterium]
MLLCQQKRQEGFRDFLQKVRPKNAKVIGMGYQVLTAADIDEEGTFGEVISLEDFIS